MRMAPGVATHETTVGRVSQLGSHLGLAGAATPIEIRHLKALPVGATTVELERQTSRKATGGRNRTEVIPTERV